jgi:hypothetical protein
MSATDENSRQTTDTVVMVRPARFQRNPQTLASNAFQAAPLDLNPEQEQEAALAEFDGLVSALTAAGVHVIVYDDTPQPHTPDAIFPNNWVSFHDDGTVVLYPMEAENRRRERRTDIVESLSNERGYRISDIVDLAYHERDGRYLEGTGSMVFDRVNRIAYACLSSRTHLDVLAEFGQRMNFDVVAFDAAGRSGRAIYHSNVMMCIGTAFAVICADAIADAQQRDAVLARLGRSGREIVTISRAQVAHFAGNMLELAAADGSSLLLMSDQARRSLQAEQLRRLESHARIVAVPVEHIERSAGGGVRCMIAEMFLPTAAD